MDKKPIFMITNFIVKPDLINKKSPDGKTEYNRVSIEIGGCFFGDVRQLNPEDLLAESVVSLAKLRKKDNFKKQTKKPDNVNLV